MANIYQQRGYANRKEYLLSLCADYGVCKEAVFALADLLGPNEDFDGLINALEENIDGTMEVLFNES